MIRRPPRSPLFPYPPLSRPPARVESDPTASRSHRLRLGLHGRVDDQLPSREVHVVAGIGPHGEAVPAHLDGALGERSEEHTSELQSLAYLVCRLLLEKKNQP